MNIGLNYMIFILCFFLETQSFCSGKCAAALNTKLHSLVKINPTKIVMCNGFC